MQKNRITLAIVTLIGAAAIAAVAVWLWTPVEHSRVTDPSGHFTAVVSTRRFWQLVPTMPGHGSDAAGLVEIFDQDHASLGRVPVPMLWLAHDLRWDGTRAEIPMVGRWELDSRTCCYWSDDREVCAQN